MKRAIRRGIAGFVCAIATVVMLGSSPAMAVHAASTTSGDSAAVDQSKIPLTNLIQDWPQFNDELNEASAVVMDADTGGILFSLNKDLTRYPASTTKILTSLLAIENCKLDDIVTMNEGLIHTTDGSTNAGTVAGEQFTVEQCLYMALLKSANDIAVQLGVQAGGSVTAFADMMNARAKEIGCTNTHFVNPSGMPDSDHYTTPGDLALIMQECLKNDEFRKIIATKQYTVPATNKTSTERVYDNHNLLIQPTSDYYYEYNIGGKTGFTQAAWRTLVTAAEKDGRTLICVTMRGPDKTDFADSKKLFEYGFNNFSNVDFNGTTITLPNGMDTSQVQQTQTVREDGCTEIVSTYNKLTVGRTVVGKEKAEAVAAESKANAASEVTDSVTAASTEAKANTQAKTSGSIKVGALFLTTPLLIAILAVLVIGIIVIGIMLSREE